MLAQLDEYRAILLQDLQRSLCAPLMARF